MSGRGKPELSIRYSRREKALWYTGHSGTSGLLVLYLERVKLVDAYDQRHGLGAKIHRPDESDERSLAQELDARGYDLTTLRFSIRKKASAPV